jgi:hypothetical protein
MLDKARDWEEWATQVTAKKSKLLKILDILNTGQEKIKAVPVVQYLFKGIAS